MGGALKLVKGLTLLRGTMVTKFSPLALPPGGETSASFKGRRTVRVGAVPPSLGAAP